MRTRTLVLFALCAALAGCASNGPQPPDDVPWHDEAFAYDPALVTVTPESLFALDEKVVRELRAMPVVANGSPATRTAELLTQVFGPEWKAFAYAGGHSTVAAETWRNRKGDCLSLSIMTVAIARAIAVPALIQEVRVPPLFDRRGGIDFVNRHVNVLVRSDREIHALGRRLPAGDIVVDFEPQVGSRQRGRPLGEAQVYARLLNNLGGEHLAGGDTRRAYAYFKRAILADPAYGPGYGNLAQLYLAAGLEAQAERLLQTAIARDEAPYTSMAALQRLLRAKGREAEASALEAELRSRRDEDPYYWLGLGVDRLQRGQLADAVEALERAQAMTSGFDEVHQALAIAYWRAGQVHMARDQLTRLGIPDARAKLAVMQHQFGPPGDSDMPPLR